VVTAAAVVERKPTQRFQLLAEELGKASVLAIDVPDVEKWYVADRTDRPLMLRWSSLPMITRRRRIRLHPESLR
jgi:hypothetical protein